MRFHPLLSLSVLLILVVASGASCPTVIRQVSQPMARVLPENPTLEQVVAVVNDNGSRINSVQVNQAHVTVPGAPALRASLAAQRQRRFRLRAAFLGADQVDIGSNDELFWIWIRQNPQPGVYFCRHDQFAHSAARAIMPVEPEWLLEALGAVTFDPSERHEGPAPVGKGRLQIKSSKRSSLGEMTKITVVDDSAGVVLEQHLYDPSGTLLASAFNRGHVRDQLTGTIMPRNVDIQWPPAKFTMKIDFNDLQVNSLPAETTVLWTKPEYPGHPNINLADPSLRILQPGQVTMDPGPATSTVPPSVIAAQPQVPVTGDSSRNRYGMQPLPRY